LHVKKCRDGFLLVDSKENAWQRAYIASRLSTHSASSTLAENSRFVADVQGHHLYRKQYGCAKAEYD